MKLRINCDGGSRGNPGPAASAFVVFNPRGEVIYRRGKYLGTATNNQAEYEAVWMALNWVAQNYPDAEMEFFLDSQLVVNQLKGRFKVKNPDLKTRHLGIKSVIENRKLKIVSFVYIPRRQNFLADSLINQSLDQQNSP